jgi:hypothetical protein
MFKDRRHTTAMLLAATALVLPVAAYAAGPIQHEAELEARLLRLEGEMQALKSDLAAAKAAQAATVDAKASQLMQVAQNADAKAEATAVKLAALEAKPQPDGFKVGATTVKLGGWIKLVATNSRFSDGEVANNAFGRDFWLPQQIPVGGAHSAREQDFSARQSRFWINLDTDVAGHSLKGYVETDFETSPGTQGTQRTTNGYNLALRRAYLQFDKWTFGQDWSTFQYTGALPESTDYVGTTEGSVFVRQPVVRYSTKVGEGMTLHVAAENPESATAIAGAPALVENGDDRMPDFATRLAWAGKAGELSLAGLARELRVESNGVAASRFGWGVSGAGKLFLDDAKISDVRFMATYGQGAGRYIGVNFAPDAVVMPGTGKLEDVTVFSAMLAARVGIVPGVRANLMGSFQHVTYADALTLAMVGGYNRQAWSVAGNLFWTPIKNVDLGIEVRHGERKLVNSASGALDRIEFAAKYGF